MNWWDPIVSGLTGGGLGGAATVTLVLTGKLLPVRTVDREKASTQTSHEEVLQGLRDTHSTAVQTLRDQHAAAMLAIKDAHSTAIQTLRETHTQALAAKESEIVRFRDDLDYERKAKDVERDRADRNADLLRSTIESTGNLLRALPDPVPSAPDHS